MATNSNGGRNWARTAAVLAAVCGAGAAAQGQITTPAVLTQTDALIGAQVDAIGEDLNVFDVGSGMYSGTLNSDVRVTGLAYDQVTRRLWMLSRGQPTTSSRLHTLDINPLSGAPTPPVTVSGVVSNVTAGGLAWDGANDRLIVNNFARIMALDTATATTSDIRNLGTAANFNGLDIDPVSGSMYAVNGSTTVSAPFSGRGIYRFDPPFDSGPIVKIAEFPEKSPGVQETDIDGAAAGHQRLYLSTDEVQSLYQLDLSTMTYGPATSQPAPTGTNVTGSGAAYIGSDDDGADVGVAIRVNADQAVPAGSNTPFLVHVRNIGSQIANSVVVTVPVPAGTAFVSATNGATHNAGVVTLNAGDLDPEEGASFEVTFASASAFTATVNATSTTTETLLSNNTASALSSVGAPDFVVTLTAPAACTVGAGQEAFFNGAAFNAGSRAAQATLAVAFPEGSDFVSSTPMGVEAGQTVTIDLGVVPAGGSVPFTVSVIPGEGLALTIGANVTAAGDANPANNSATASTVTVIFGQDYPAYEALLSTLGGSPNNTIPGMVGAFSGTGSLDAQRSANDMWLATDWDSDGGTDVNEVAVLTNLATGTSSVLWQEGVTVLPGGATGAFTVNGFGVNSAGDTGWGGRDNGATTTDGYVAKRIAGTISIAMREGDPVPAIAGATYGSVAQVSGGYMLDNGQSYFTVPIAGVPTTENEAFLSGDGTILVAQKGSTPIGADGPLTDISNTGFYISADGTKFIFQGTTTTGGTKTVLVSGTVGMNGTVLVKTGNVLPGFSSPVSNFEIQSSLMTPEGRWFIRGSNSDGEDWVFSGTTSDINQAQLIMRTGPTGAGLPIHPGATELWDPSASTANTIAAATGNSNGDYVVLAGTNGDTRSNVVMVLNNERVIMREGDPVDLNDNGVFDDEFFVAEMLGEDQMVVTDDAVYAVMRLRDRGTVCTNGTPTHMALIKIPLPTGPSDCDIADFDGSGNVDATDIFIFLDAWFAQNGMSGPNLSADTDGSGTVDATDIFIFLDFWFAQNGQMC